MSTLTHASCLIASEPPATESMPSFCAFEYVIPVGDHSRHRKDPFEGVGNFEIDVTHRTASSDARRSAACAAASVAETVPISTSSAVAIDR